MTICTTMHLLQTSPLTRLQIQQCANQNEANIVLFLLFPDHRMERAVPCSSFHFAFFPVPPICLPASPHLSHLNEAVTLSNRRWLSFSCTETLPPCLYYVYPHRSFPISLSQHLLSSLAFPAPYTHDLLVHHSSFFCGIADSHHIELLFVNADVSLFFLSGLCVSRLSHISAMCFKCLM